jgi:Mg-chelatase subunit ChlD
VQTQINSKLKITLCPTCRAEYTAAHADHVPKAFALIDLLNAVKHRASNDDDDDLPAPAAPAPPANDDGVQINVTAHRVDGNANSNVADVLIKLVPPAGSRRTPGDYALVIDVSGSMGVEAKLKNESGESESHGLSLLDVVKHAATTVANVLGDDDRLALVAYSSQSKIVLPLTKMDEDGKKKALEEIGLLHPDDMTNMWAGIYDGIMQLAPAKDSGRASYVFVLTDGQPNVEPARGHLRAVDDLCKSLEWRCTLSTFGFGYGIESPLLRDLAVVTGGNYIFIPDSSFVGTAFVNAVSHALTTVGQQARVTIVPQNGATLLDADGDTLGGHQVVGRHDGAVTLGIGAIGADTNKHVVVRMQLPEVDTKDAEKAYCEVTLDYNGTTGSAKTVQRVALGYRRDGGVEVVAQRCRTKLVEVLAKASQETTSASALAKAQAAVRELVDSMAPLRKNKVVAGLIGDLNGQVTEAFQRYDWFNRWGKHYIPSLCRSHALEVCSNFKDVGLQGYAGPLFEQMQQIGDDIFCKLPAPKPAPPPAAVLQAMNMTAAAWQAQAQAPQVSMSTYHTSDGPCFPVTTRVHLANGERKLAGEVRRGDLVRTATGTASRVQCIVRTVSPNGKFNIVTLPDSGLKVTPFHPVHVGGRWQFPINVAGRQLAVESHEAVVSFLLEDRAPTMLIDDTVVITLAHGQNDDAVAEHEFFGTERVVESLSQLKGYAQGLVQLRSGECLVRATPNGRVCGLRQ